MVTLDQGSGDNREQGRRLRVSRGRAVGGPFCRVDGADVGQGSLPEMRGNWTTHDQVEGLAEE